MKRKRLFDDVTFDPIPDILEEVLAELAAGKKKHPRWPVHLAGQGGIVCEEVGELIRECIGLKYEGKKDKSVTIVQRKAAIRKEAIQVAAVALRFLENLK